jgi:tetratricopeptide (TPR) repeat protein
MKKIILTMIATAGVAALHAQSVEQGQKELYYHRYQSAENTFHQLINQDANNAVAWYDLAKTFVLEDKLPSADSLIQKAPASIQADPWFQVAAGRVLLEEGKNAEAGNYYKAALDETRQKDAGILAAIAEAHISAKTGDANYALEVLKNAIKRDKHNASLYELVGDAYLKLNNGSEAFKAYQQANQQDDHDASAYYKTGQIFVSQKNPELYEEYFKKAIAADPAYAPALHSLYVYEVYRDPAKAMEYYKNYMANSDASIQNEYDLTDLLYLNKEYDKAIEKAKSLTASYGDKVQPRLYKLIGYSYAEKKDTATALSYMQQYLNKEADSNLIPMDYISMGQFYTTQAGQDSMAVVYLEKGVSLEKDAAKAKKYYQTIANLARDMKDFATQAKWLGKYYMADTAKAGNLDLFNWGLALYRAEDFTMADSVFGMYSAKYPEQSFGYYWQAKSKALQDKDMQLGLAIPAYQKVIEVLSQHPDDPNYKNWMVDAYSYLAAYEVNKERDYAQGKEYFEKVLTVDPENSDAKKYIDLLDKTLADKGTK